MKNYISILVLAIVSLFAGTTLAYNVPAYNGFVNDYAGKLSPKQLGSLNATVRRVNAQTANEIGVLIIPGLDGEDISDVAHKTFNTWKVGKAGLDNGVLLVIAVKDRKMRIETGKGVGGDLTDLQTQDIQDHMKPYLRKDDFYGAVNLAVSEIGSSIETRRKQKDGGLAVSDGPKNVSCQASPLGLSDAGLGFTLLAVFGVILLFAVRYFRGKTRHGDLAERYEALPTADEETTTALMAEIERLEERAAAIMSARAAAKSNELRTAIARATAEGRRILGRCFFRRRRAFPYLETVKYLTAPTEKLLRVAKVTNDALAPVVSPPKETLSYSYAKHYPSTPTKAKTKVSPRPVKSNAGIIAPKKAAAKPSQSHSYTGSSSSYSGSSSSYSGGSDSSSSSSDSGGSFGGGDSGSSSSYSGGSDSSSSSSDSGGSFGGGDSGGGGSSSDW